MNRALSFLDGLARVIGWFVALIIICSMGTNKS
jgi:hypothetical protein